MQSAAKGRRMKHEARESTASTEPRDSRKALADEILADARRQAERAQKKARREAGKTEAEAQEKAAAERETVLAEAKERAQHQREMILRTVLQETNKRRLAAQEVLIGEVMDEARQQVLALSDEEFARVLVNLAASALGAMPDDEVRVQVSASGRAIDFSRLADDMARAVEEKAGRRVTLHLESADDLAPGIVVYSMDGRRTWDNTLDARITRLSPTLRREMAPVLFPEEKDTGRESPADGDKA